MISKSSHTVPPSVHKSFILWLIAIGAGVFETAIVVYGSVFGGSNEDGLITGVAIRLVIFAVMTYVILKMRQGKNWARIVLAIGLGVLGSLSLLIGPIEWFSTGHSLADAFTGLALQTLLFMASRIVHMLAVWAGLLLMFLPESNLYFKAKK
jgi:hypothetical protein